LIKDVYRKGARSRTKTFFLFSVLDDDILLLIYLFSRLTASYEHLTCNVAQASTMKSNHHKQKKEGVDREIAQWRQLTGC
jgi:hypothetical protein